MLCFEIQSNLDAARSEMSKVEKWIWEYGPDVDSGTFVGWVSAHRHWKDTVANLELKLVNAEFQMFRDFTKKEKKG